MPDPLQSSFDGFLEPVANKDEAQPEQVGAARAKPNAVDESDRPFHGWYRFVLSYPPHLVREYLDRFGLPAGAAVLDPFCGTGTTIVEAKRQGMVGVGLEANPFPQFAGTIKTNWSVVPSALNELAHVVAAETRRCLADQHIDDNAFGAADRNLRLRDIAPEAKKLLIENSISPLPLHKVLVLQDVLRNYQAHPAFGHALLALGNALVTTIGNLRFGPEVGVGKLKADVPVVSAWLAQVERMVADLQSVEGQAYPPAVVHLADARNLMSYLRPGSIDAVITSPPYPNEKDYTRTTRLESVLLGFYDTKAELRAFKKTLLRSNTRGVYQDDNDDALVDGDQALMRIADAIEARRLALNKTSGFEKLYARTTLLYFGGMRKHLEQMREVLRPGAQLAYVVGDQASYLQVMIRTGELLASLAEAAGYEVTGIDLFRTRYATATQNELREEVVVLKWPKERLKVFVMADRPKDTLYQQIIAEIFRRHYQPGAAEFEFEREEISQVASELGLAPPKNLGDVTYTFRYRGNLPVSISATVPSGQEWLIRPAGRSRYRFVLGNRIRIEPNPATLVLKIPDATPGIIAKYAKNDEQALLAILRYNRLIDIFTGLTCYSIQSHLRTTVKNLGQVETDELYVGMDRWGVHYVLPVQAKGHNDSIGIVQLEQDFALCAQRYPQLVCRALAAKFIGANPYAGDLTRPEFTIALFELTDDKEDGVRVVQEKHYRLVPPSELSDQELAQYRTYNP